MAALTFEKLLAGRLRCSDDDAEQAVVLRLRLSLPLPPGRGPACIAGSLATSSDAPVPSGPLVGEAALGPRRQLRYQLRLVPTGGSPMALTLESSLRLDGMPAGFTLVEGALRDADGTLLATLSLRFDPRDGGMALLRSLAIERGRPDHQPS
jgi:hypothetical protein